MRLADIPVAPKKRNATPEILDIERRVARLRQLTRLARHVCLNILSSLSCKELLQRMGSKDAEIVEPMAVVDLFSGFNEMLEGLPVARDIGVTSHNQEKLMSQPKLSGIEVCVFDAYGTLFDVSSVARGAQDALGEGWQALSDLWRTKQLQYTWLRGLAGHHADFWQVTGDALDFALTTLKLDQPALRERLMNLYLSIEAYPEVPATLQKLRAIGLKTAILSNGSPTMLDAAVDNARLGEMLDAVLSVESVGVFKPHPDVYGLASKHFAVSPEKVCFLSSNSWDAFSAKAFGFHVLWCNRFGQQPERIPDLPDGEIDDLSRLAAWLEAK